MLFEENKNIWLFNKVLFSAVILVNLGGPGVLQGTILQVIEANEKDPERKKKVLEEIATMLQGLNVSSLDSKNRDLFTQKFTNFKTFLYTHCQY